MRRYCLVVVLGIGDGSRLKLLDDGSHSRWLRRRTWFIKDLDLGRRKHAPDAVDKLQRILLRPEVDVERMQLVVIFGLVARVVGGQMPFALVDRLGNGQRDGAVLLV